MASKKQIILASLKHLSEYNYERFCSALVNRGGERKVRKSKVEGQSRENVTTVLLSTFTKDGAPAVVSEVLKFIGCVDEATKLDTAIDDLDSIHLLSQMAFKKKIISDMLENLSKENYAKFCSALLDRGGERKVPKSEVEGQLRCEVANVLVSTFTEAGAPAVVSEVLRFIGCLNEAKDLDAEIEECDLPSKMASKKKIILDSLENLSKEDYARFCSALVNRGGERKVPKSKVEDQPQWKVTNVLLSIFTDAEAPGVVSQVLKFIGYYNEADALDAAIAEIDKKSLNASPEQTHGAPEGQPVQGAVGPSVDRDQFQRHESQGRSYESPKSRTDAFVVEEPKAAAQSQSPVSRTVQVTMTSPGAEQLGVANVPGSSNSSGKHFVDKHKLQLIQRVVNIDPILDGLLYKRVLQDGAYEDISQTAGNQHKMRKIYDLALKSGDTAKDVFMELLREKEPYLVKDLLKDP